jgi:hypothetical protein
MKLYHFLFVLIFFSAFAQDERFYRQIFDGALIPKEAVQENIKLIISSPKYHFDLNRNGFNEILETPKRDGLDYIVIKDGMGKLIYEAALDSMAKDSYIDKIQLKSLSATTDLMLIYYYEGGVDSSKFEASARLYFLTFENRDLKTLSLYRGPHYFHEKQKVLDQYLLRSYHVSTLDLNDDGVKEVMVHYNKIARIFFYQGKGNWTRF